MEAKKQKKITELIEVKQLKIKIKQFKTNKNEK
jgi:hypothetical protein